MPVQFKTDPLPIENQGEMHIPVVLLLDISASMTGAPIAELNQGLIAFGEALREDPLALGRAEVCVISFNSTVQTEMGFRPASQYEAPVLEANGATSLNEAIEKGLDLIEARKDEYKLKGISYYRPWLFVLTDGVPTDSQHEAAAKSRLRSAIENKKVVYMPMGIGERADKEKLQSYYPENTQAKLVLQASCSHFKEAFVWLSNSISVISQSDPKVSTQVNLPHTPSIITVGI